MKATEFKTWMEAFNRMSRGQRDTLRLQLQGKPRLSISPKSAMFQSAWWLTRHIFSNGHQ